jgi:hypothetical protein
VFRSTDFTRGIQTCMKIYSKNSRHGLPVKRMPLAQPVANTPLAKRMLEQMGESDYQLVKTFQQHFGAKLVHYQDKAGEVGKRPGWAE